MTKDKYDKMYKMGTEAREVFKDATLREFVTVICTTIDDYCEHHGKDPSEIAKTICVAIQVKGEKK